MINIISELLFETWTFILFTIKKNRFVSMRHLNALIMLVQAYLPSNSWQCAENKRLIESQNFSFIFGPLISV